MYNNEMRNSGFTLVELLVVIVVIAILAAISVVAYSGIQNRAHDAVVRSDASSITRSLELARLSIGHYPFINAEWPSDFKFSKASYATSALNALYCADKVLDHYALGVTSKSGKSYMIVDSTISEVASFTPTSVCQAAGRPTWVTDASTYTVQGYIFSTSTWNAAWSWSAP